MEDLYLNPFFHTARKKYPEILTLVLDSITKDLSLVWGLVMTSQPLAPSQYSVSLQIVFVSHLSFF